jgi:hypothetical protein
VPVPIPPAEVPEGLAERCRLCAATDGGAGEPEVEMGAEVDAEVFEVKSDASAERRRACAGRVEGPELGLSGEGEARARWERCLAANDEGG